MNYGSRIAVIDDETDYIDLMQQVLELRGWDIIPIRQADCADEMVRATLPDLVLLDIRFHGPETGWDVLTCLRADERTRDIPVVICSAMVDELLKHEAWLAERAIRVVPKPFDLDDLHATIEAELTKAHRPAGELAHQIVHVRQALQLSRTGQ